MSEIENKKLVLEELRRAFDSTYAAGDALDAKLYSLLNFSSLAVAFATALQISTLSNQVGVIFWEVLVCVLVLYIINFIVIGIGLRPLAYHFGVSGQRRKIIDDYFKPSTNAVINQVIGNYIESIDEAKTNNERKSICIYISAALLFFMVIALVSAFPLGLLHPTPTLSQFLPIPTTLTPTAIPTLTPIATQIPAPTPTP